MGYAVKIVDKENRELPSVYSEKYKAVFVVANPGTPFQIRVELGRDAERNVKAEVRVDGREIGFKPWLNKEEELIGGFRKDQDNLYQFEFSQLRTPDVQVREEDEDDKDDEEEDLHMDPNGAGAVRVIFYKFHKGEEYCNRPECQRFLQRPRYNPYGGGGGRARNPLERERFELRKEDIEYDEQTKKWWKKQNMAAKPGQEIADPRARPRPRAGRAPSRSMARHHDGYGSPTPYGGGGSRGYGGGGYGRSSYRGGVGYADAGPPPKCPHMRFQKGKQLGEFVAYYDTVDVLILRGVLDPDEYPEHKQILEDCGYFKRERQKTLTRRQQRKLERARKKSNYEPKIEPGIVVNLEDDDDDAMGSIADVNMDDDKEVKAENKVFMRSTKGKEVCDLTRQENMEVWMVQPKQKTTPLIPLE